MSTLTKTDFNADISEIFRRSTQIGDSWKLVRVQEKLTSPSAFEYLQQDDTWNPLDVLFLEKQEQVRAREEEKSTQEEVAEEQEDLASCHTPQLITFLYHVIYSESYSVPVLYLNGYRANGKPLNYEEVYDHFKLKYDLKNREPARESSQGDQDDEAIEMTDIEPGSDDSDVQSQLVLTQQEHPYLFKPFFFMHPCKTGDWMLATKISRQPDESSKQVNYTLKWLSFVFSALDIKLDLKYAVDLDFQ